MSDEYFSDNIIDMYIFETGQNIERLESIVLDIEKSCLCNQDTIDEVFRIMHTIKGSSAMMVYENIATLAHVMEDLFYYFRQNKVDNLDCSTLSDRMLDGIDFIKIELEKVKAKDKVDGDASAIIQNIRKFLELFKQQKSSDIEIKKEEPEVIGDYEGKSFEATIFFQDGCEMENIRAFTIMHNLEEFSKIISFFPQDIMENEDSAGYIKENGFKVSFNVDKSYEEMETFFKDTIFFKNLELIELSGELCELDETHKLDDSLDKPDLKEIKHIKNEEAKERSSLAQSIISVNTSKLDQLMDLVGEMVVAEAMVIQNPDLKGLELDNFSKAARQLHKITSELQDTVMSIRMVPLFITFEKMNRIVRDMTKKLNKQVKLNIIGGDTEVDKNIIDHISDPLMHLVRNAIDHGIEDNSERELNGKPRYGSVTLEAKNVGSDVLVIIKDDGKGLNKEKILEKARKQGMIIRPESEMTDKEIYNLIFLPGFSTTDKISEFSGRGVGMDVVVKNIESVGGSVYIDSEQDVGSTITLKIPLTLAIIDGMNVSVGKSHYTIPINAIKESFRPKSTDIVVDPENNKIVMVRGECYSIISLHEYYGVETDIKDFTEGIFIMVEQNEKMICIFADELLGQQQVVVKPLPKYIQNIKEIKGLAGCSLLGDGSISLILDINSIIGYNRTI